MRRHFENASKACEVVNLLVKLFGGNSSGYLQEGWNMVAKYGGDNKALKGGGKSKVSK